MEIINENNSELFKACRTGNIELVEKIMNTSFININAVDSDGDTPLIIALVHWHPYVVKKLLEHPDLDVNAPSTSGLTPLMWSIFWSDPNDGEHFDIVKTLLKVPSLQLGKSCDNGCTALHYACQSNTLSFFKQIINDTRCNIALVNKKDNDGYTPLMTAVVMGHIDIVKELDIEGTDYNITNMYGKTLIQMARTRNNSEIVDYLMNRPNVDTLMVICAQNICRYLTTIDDIELLQIPFTVKQFLARFVN